MPSEVLIVRFPDGSKEFRYPEKMLEEGDVLRHDGERYRVISVNLDEGSPWHATVELVSPGLGGVLKSEQGGIRLDEIVGP